MAPHCSNLFWTNQRAPEATPIVLKKASIRSHFKSVISACEMGRSRESSKRKRSSGSKDSGHCAAKRYSDYNNLSKNDKSSQSTSESSLQSTYNVITYSQVPYWSWLTYFQNQEYNEKSSTVMKIDASIDFFTRYPSTAYDVEKGLNIDINLCINDSALRAKWPSIIEDFNNNPHHTLNCINAAFFEVMMQRAIKEDRGNVEEVFKILRLNRTNLLNYESLNPLSCVKLSSYGKLISISGIVVGTGRSKLSLNSIVFVCKCKREILSKPRNEMATVPKKCNVCGDARMKRLPDSPYESKKLSQNIYVKDYRTIEQIIDGATISPNIISVRLTTSLVDKFMNGDKIRIIGIPRVTLGVVKTSTSGTNPLYVDAKSVFKDDPDNLRENIDTRIIRSVIEKIKSESDVLSLLVNSLCPSVQGHEIVKAALVLGLFAGTCNINETHRCINLLIIGNLGLGKSQLLRACAKIAPEGTYVRGSSTILGSTMTAARDNFTEDYRLEAGALTLANSGFLFLDELDKMSNQHRIIYNAMVRQRVLAMNSEFSDSLSSRTAIFAMTNSTKKRYDQSKTVEENVNASKQLLGCFDLIFVMRDNPNTYLDKLMSERVLNERTKRSALTQQTKSSDRGAIDEPRINADRTLSERLVTSNEHGSTDLLNENNIRMYVNYARLYVKPVLSRSSKIIIQRYCSLRRQKERNFRKFERYVKILEILTEARAKIDLRVETSEQDVFDAIEILEQSMSIGIKDLAQPRSTSNAKKLTTNKMKQFLEDLRTESVELRKNIFTIEELRNIAGQENTTGITFSILLSRLNEQGYLLKISSDSYKIVFH